MKQLVARQPIYDGEDVVLGYEIVADDILSGVEVADGETVGNIRSLIENLQGLNPEKKVFLDVSLDQLTSQSIRQVPYDKAILQVSSLSEMSLEILSRCEYLHEAGYSFSFGNFILDEEFNELTAVADIIRVDFSASSDSDIRLAAMWARSQETKLLAYNVPSRTILKTAQSLRYHYFHGQFAFEAEVVSKADLPGFKVNYIRLLDEINNPDLDFDRLDQIIKRDVSLTFKLLKYINSAAFGLSNEIGSIKHALSLLGDREVKKWATLVALTNMAKDLPEESVITCMHRGKFLEELATETGQGDRKDDLFFMGIFSMIDLFSGRPLDEMLESLPIRQDIKDALLGIDGPFNTLLKLILDYEQGNWDPLQAYLGVLGIGAAEVSDIYFDALEWTEVLYSE